MRIYFEAFDAEKKKILGTLDGQGVLFNSSPTTYTRTKHYKRLRNEPKEKLSFNGRAKYYKVVDQFGYVLETIIMK